MSRVHPEIVIIGAGLAGSEAALQLARRGIPVRLYDMKPHKTSPAHHNPNLAEIVCSNSFGSQGETTASGLLKRELDQLGCKLLAIARTVSVPAGQALAVDRDAFARAVTDRIRSHPDIDFVPQELGDIPPEADYVLVATGPLTSADLARALAKRVNREQLFFFDAASPIVTRESVNLDVAFLQDRYALERQTRRQVPEETGQAYINCPLDKPQYEALVAFILQAEKAELKDFETSGKASFFESCLPVEVLAARGQQTLRYGPMKPVGLVDPHTGRRPYAVVQLRQDNREGTLYNLVGFQTNLKWGPQKDMIRLIPGLEGAEVIRYGVMHRNTYLHSPEVLHPTLQLKHHPRLLVAGQLTGTEGYTESIATGRVAALNLARLAAGQDPLVFPRETMIGALLQYVTREEAVGKPFQPINSNWGLLPPLDPPIRDKQTRNAAYADRALAKMSQFIRTETLDPTLLTSAR